MPIKPYNDWGELRSIIARGLWMEAIIYVLDCSDDMQMLDYLLGCELDIEHSSELYSIVFDSQYEKSRCLKVCTLLSTWMGCEIVTMYRDGLFDGDSYICRDSVGGIDDGGTLKRLSEFLSDFIRLSSWTNSADRAALVVLTDANLDHLSGAVRSTITRHIYSVFLGSVLHRVEGLRLFVWFVVSSMTRGGALSKEAAYNLLLNSKDSMVYSGRLFHSKLMHDFGRNMLLGGEQEYTKQMRYDGFVHVLLTSVMDALTLIGDMPNWVEDFMSLIRKSRFREDLSMNDDDEVLF